MNIQTLHGNWKAGWALDLHTIRSIPIGNGHFDTTYTEIGFALKHLKYRQDYRQIDILVDAALEFMKTRLVTPYLNAIIPTPASVNRAVQPVHAIAKKIGEKLKIRVDANCLLKTKDTNQLKMVEDQSERENILHGAFDVTDSRYRQKKVLLFDDFFRSGSTLMEITKTLYEKGKVQNVYVFTLTKTRSKK
jgi:competence protein ComFC